MPKTPIIQVDLRNNHNERLTTWVDVRPGLEAGKYITLKDFQPDTVWKVITIYTETIKDADEFSWHRKWSNNV